MTRKLVISFLLLFAVGGVLELTGLATPIRPVEAQSGAYNTTWSTVDNGGGTSTGGAYTFSGTIGQPEAGSSNAGAYSHSGGFWGGLATRVVQGVSVYLPLILR